MWIYYVAGISLCVLGVFEIILILINKNFYNETTQAIVISLDSRLSKVEVKDKREFYPTYEYKVNGQIYRKQFIPELYNSNKYSIRQEDTIKYSSEKPENFIVLNGKNPYLYYSAYIIGVAIIILLTCFGILPKLF